MAEDYYSILGVTKDATSQEIKRAFREIARKSHPDLAGADPTAEEQFKSARKAYETLMDPVARARYDRRGQRVPASGTFFDAFYKATERAQTQKAASSPPPRSAPTGRRNPGNSVTLDDLFNDFGDFGFGEGKGSAPRPSEPSAHRPSPKQGEDVHIDLDVPRDLAASGGSLTAVYYRMQRADSWRPGSPDPGIVRVQDIADIRILPGTPHGEILRERGLGNAGQHGGPYGDLLVRVQIVKPTVEPKVEPKPAPKPAPPEPEATQRASEPENNGHIQGPTVDLTIVEAILGGRVAIDTPQGRVRLTIPPGTSSGVQLRLKGRGLPSPGGEPADYYVWTRIVVPKELDEASRRLIEEYARLNPSTAEE